MESRLLIMVAVLSVDAPFAPLARGLRQEATYGEA
jgi:hypothetical protein